MTDSHLVHVGLGGNVGDVVATMAMALQLLDANSDVTVEVVSPVYRTPPWGIEDQDWFHNACARLVTTLEPQSLLATCLSMELQQGRVRRQRWGPRTLDIDILLFGNITLKKEALTIPHPRMTERAFVMQPLCDIAPQQVVNGKTVEEWNRLLDKTGMEKLKLPKDWWSASKSAT